MSRGAAQAIGSQASGPARRDLALLGVVLAVVTLGALRASLGISFLDDASYVVIPLRFAQGARPLADEMTVQGLGFLVAVPFVKAWTVVFGTTGLVLATRLFYVALATVVCVVAYRAFRPSFGSWAAAIAIIAVILAPPYNVMALSYNTAAELAFVLAIALAWRAVRDRSRGAALGAGAALAFAAFSYPTLAPVALVAGLALLVAGWRRGIFVSFLLGIAAVSAVLWGLLLVIASPHDAVLALHYSSGTWGANASLTSRASQLLMHLRADLLNRWLLPAWLLVAISCIPWLSFRWRAWTLALIPLIAVALPAWHHLGRRGYFFGQLGTAYLVMVSVVLALPVAVRLVQEYEADRHSPTWRLFLIAAPPALLGFVAVALSTSSGWFRGVAFVGLAPLTVVLLAQWGHIVRRDAGRLAFALAATGLVAVLVVTLFASSFKVGPSLSLTHRIWHGPLAGMAVSYRLASEIAVIESQGRRWVHPADSVLVYSAPLGYLLVGGHPYTNAVWLQSGPRDQATVDYYRRRGHDPDVVFVSRGLIATSGRPSARAGNPLLSFLKSHYRVVDAGQFFYVLVPKAPAGQT